MTIPPGTRFGRYAIRSQLGAGGMGVVYLAQDTQLDRTVALKVLPADVASDGQRMHRFIQEAKAASALNHPNIITIYEIGKENSAHFISTEFISGETLRRRMKRERMSLMETLDIAAQVAAALSAAHVEGIIHRDIKPENIMVREDGYVKVLDFGLAKLMEKTTGQLAADPEAPTQAPMQGMVNTEPGMVMGTARYMSPEQARGFPVDARTDLWSLGCVLYEMVAGHAPFESKTTSDVIALILRTDPPPLHNYVPDAPIELQRILRKALRKDCDERYQTAKDLLVDLRSLRRDLEIASEMERSGSAQSHHIADTLITYSSTQQSRYEQASASAGRVTETQSAHPTSSAEYLASELRRHKKGALVALAIFAVALLALGLGLYKFVWQKNSVAHFQTTRITRLTSNGKASDVSISPDGKYIVYVLVDGGLRSLRVKHLATDSDVQIVPPAEMKSMGGTTFSLDGNYIYYVVNDKNNPQGALHQVAVLGGTPKRLVVDLSSPVTLSPDGKQMAFVRQNPEQGENALIVAQADGTGERKIASRVGTNWFSDSGPSWSPDGKMIACGIGGTDGGYHMTVAVVPAEGGEAKPITGERWHVIDRVVWFDDASGVAFSAKDHPFAPSQIWQLSYPEGVARRITGDLGNYGSVSLGLTANSLSLITVQADRVSNIWTAPNGDASRARQITSRGNIYDGQAGMAWTPDGKVVYASNASGNSDIWVMSADGAGQKQLTDDAHFDGWPVVSPDGSYIIFVSGRTGTLNIWRMNVDGSEPKQLSNGKIDDHPDCSPDGKWIVYESLGDTGFPALWKVSIDGGGAMQLTDKWSSHAVISPDGSVIAFVREDEQASKQLKLLVMPFAGGAPSKSFDFPLTIIPLLSWSPDGKSLVYNDTRSGISNLWSQPVDGDKPTQLTDFKSDQIFFFNWSRDGRQLALARGTVARDVVLISDTK
jgi:serine/threonine protein kinase/Tol biopolymer transport system component